jgi:aspartyl-tRNA(Asn)/glutamyl-tRNA(Gln) amidotransferase subunit B
MSKPTPKTIANIITTYLKPVSEKYGIDFEQVVTPSELTQLASLFDEKKINNQGLQKALDLLAQADDVDSIESFLEEHNLVQISDDSVLSEIVETVISDNPTPVADYKGGKEQSIGFLIGQCMKASKGSGNPQKFRELLITKLAN